MAQIDLHVFVRTTPDKVWEVLSDLSGQERWMVDVRTLEITSAQREGVGAVIKVTSELFGLPVIHDVMEVTAWEPGKELSVVHRGQFTGSASFFLSPTTGGTVFRWLEIFDPPLGPLGELAHMLFVKPHLTRVFKRSMNNVKALAEARA